MEETSQLSSKSLDHLGIVAGVCKEIGLVQLLNDLTNSDAQRAVSVGEGIYAMVLNGLGFANQTLYLTPNFFRDKAVDVLFGGSVEPEDLNSHSLGTALDAVYEAGISRVFFNVALKAIRRYGIIINSRHLDGTNFAVHGQDYSGDASKPGVISLKRGHNKQGRHDLKQFTLEMISCNVEGIPLFIKAASGNSTDKTEFPEVLKAYMSQMQETGQSLEEGHYVADSALYCEATLQQIKSILWISRVPMTIGRAQKALDKSVSGQWQDFADAPGYQYQEIRESYGGTAQRWLIIRSENAYGRSEKTVEGWVEKQEASLNKGVRKLQKPAYKSEKQARQTALNWYKNLKARDKRYYELGEVKINPVAHYAPGRRKADTPPQYIDYKIERIDLARNEPAIQAHKEEKAKFILATNDLDDQRLAPDRWLHLYKNDQQGVERGFRFLKDPMFLLDYIFLQLPRRIMALSMVMALCLLIYTLAQFKLRKALQKAKKTILNQVKKPTDRPTMRWVFQLLTGIHVIYIKTGQNMRRMVANLDETQIRILKLLGENTMAYYTV